MERIKKKLEKHLILKGYAKSTRKTYRNAVFGFLKFYNISQVRSVKVETIENYLIYLINEKKVSNSHYKHVVSSLTILFNEIYKKKFKLLSLVKAPKQHRIPVVLSKQEINKIFAQITNLKHRAIMITIYSAGLRVNEAVNLTINDIESKRDLIKINNSKNGKDRYTILGQKTLEILRQYWKQYRSTSYLFYSAKKKDISLSTRTVQKEFKKAVRKAGITKKGVVVHTLRHSFGTHLYESGVDLRTIQELMGHKSPTTTAMYVHVSKRMISKVVSPIDLKE